MVRESILYTVNFIVTHIFYMGILTVVILVKYLAEGHNSRTLLGVELAQIQVLNH